MQPGVVFKNVQFDTAGLLLIAFFPLFLSNEWLHFDLHIPHFMIHCPVKVKSSAVTSVPRVDEVNQKSQSLAATGLAKGRGSILLVTLMLWVCNQR